MKTYIAVGAAAVLIISCGLVNGYWSGWIGHASESEVLTEFSARLDKVPKVIGDWVGEDQKEMDPREQAIAGAHGVVARTYTNQRTKQIVSIYLACGHFRSIAQHTPNQCYVAAGYQMLKTEQKYDVPTDAGTVECYTTVFKKEESLIAHYQRVFWTWSYNGEWLAPNLPRVALRGQPALYKLYFYTETAESVPIEETPSVEFMKEFIPTVNAVLFPNAAESPAEGAPADDSAPAADAAPATDEAAASANG